MANLDITHSAHRIRIYLFNERIRVYKAYWESTGLVSPAEVSFAGVGGRAPAEARTFANWLTVAAGLADDLDRLIVSEADFGRVVVEPWQTGASGEKRGAVKAFDADDQIIIYHPAAWVE